MFTQNKFCIIKTEINTLTHTSTHILTQTHRQTKSFIYKTSGTDVASPAGGYGFLILLLLVPAKISVVDR